MICAKQRCRLRFLREIAGFVNRFSHVAKGRFLAEARFLCTFATWKSEIHNLKKPNAMNKETWKFILQTLAAILTAIATSIGVSSCTLNLLNY